MSDRSPYYKDRLKTRIQELVSSYTRTETRANYLKLISITKVDLSEDLGHAKIYWDTFNLEKRENIGRELSNLQGSVRKYLASKLEVRHTPSVNFIFDSQYMEEMKISQLLASTSAASSNNSNV